MDQARHIYIAIRDSPGRIAQLRDWYAELAMDSADPSKALETTSFTLNGQSGSGTLRGTKADLLTLIGRVLWQIDNGAALSTRTTGVRLC